MIAILNRRNQLFFRNLLFVFNQILNIICSAIRNNPTHFEYFSLTAPLPHIPNSIKEPRNARTKYNAILDKIIKMCIMCSKVKSRSTKLILWPSHKYNFTIHSLSLKNNEIHKWRLYNDLPNE